MRADDATRAHAFALAGLASVVICLGAACRQPAAAAPAELERLGQLLFEDPSLSEPPGQSCASCHDPARAFTGNGGSRIEAISRGAAPGVFGNRNAPTLAYASFRPPFRFVTERNDKGELETKPVGGFFWDGRADTLAEQAMVPFLNPREMNNPTPAAVVEKVRRGPHAGLFRRVYGPQAFDEPGAAFQRIGQAIAAFELTPRFHRFSSKFDDFLRGRAALDRQEARGFALFRDPEKGNCIACHAAKADSKKPADWLFTDFTFDALGLPRHRGIPDNSDPAFFDLGLCEAPQVRARAPAGFDVGALCGAFQVPSLRNVDLTAPYGHNGVFASLRDLVRFYVTRDINPARLDDLPPRARRNVNTDEAPYDRKPSQPARLDDEEIDAIVAFLRTLTDR